MAELAEVTPDGRLVLNFHRGQRRALESAKRFILVLAGWQSGKTVIGPPWLYREIRRKGPGDYLVASPTYPLMAKKVLPDFLKLFHRTLGLGNFSGHPNNCFTFSPEGARRTFGGPVREPTKVFFGHARDPDSLESATGKAAWLDEAGQADFKLASWEAVLGRLSIHEGRVLLTSRPYNLGWLKQVLYDPWEASGRNHPRIDVVNFRSLDNPAFPRAEYERARVEMPAWKFLMAYDGLFTRPAGLIYDAFDPVKHQVPRFAVPQQWPRYLGLDFGGVNTAGVFYAEEPGAGRYFAYREYRAGGRTAAGHAEELLRGEPMIPFCVGGSHSEGQWRNEFAAAGLPVHEPAVKDVEVGIDRVYGAHQAGQILVMDDLAGYLDQKMSYSRKVDEMGRPTEDIENKSEFHWMDAERYLFSWLRDPRWNDTADDGDYTVLEVG